VGVQHQCRRGGHHVADGSRLALHRGAGVGLDGQGVQAGGDDHSEVRARPRARSPAAELKFAVEAKGGVGGLRPLLFVTLFDSRDTACKMSVRATAGRAACSPVVPKWRNWQTRVVQVHVLARVWGFESLLRHQKNFAKLLVSKAVGDFCFGYDKAKRYHPSRGRPVSTTSASNGSKYSF
jgi:hypothetical protein